MEDDKTWTITQVMAHARDEPKYYAMPIDECDPRMIDKWGRMTREEAIAIMKLLNAATN
jgi:hypothetical protein